MLYASCPITGQPFVVFGQDTKSSNCTKAGPYVESHFPITGQPEMDVKYSNYTTEADIW